MASVKTIYSLEELLEGSRINKAQWDKIDSNLWLKRADTSSDETQLNTMIARVICDYTSEQLFDDDLFYAFREEFEDWTQEMFEEVDLAFRREMKRFLRSRGVYTGNNKGKMGSQFASLIKMEDNPQWDPVELNTTTFEAGSRRAQATMKQELPVRSTPNPNVVIPSVEATTEGSRSVPPQSASIHQPVQLSTNPYNWVPPSRPSTYPAITPFPPPVGLPVYDEYKSLPPRPVPNKRLDPTKSTQFVKTYDREKKYTGEPYDLLDDKMRIFFNICYHAEITPEQFHAVFPRILTSRAEEYYLHYVERNDDFATAYAKIKNQFDTNVNHNQYYTDWTSTTFAKTRQQNPDKDLYEVRRTMLDKMQLCQRALGAGFAGENNLRTAVINACRGVRELEHALFKPALNCEELFADLRSSIETHLSRTTAQQMITDSDEQYYLDRRYTNNRGRGGFRGNPVRGGYRGNNNNFRSNNSRGNFRHPWKKKCYVCGKEGFWSTKHTDEERRLVREQYTAHCNFTGGNEEFSVFLTEYEGHEMDQQWLQYDEDDDSYDSEGDGGAIVQYLTDQAVLHHLTGDDIYHINKAVPATHFIIEDRYSRLRFQGILPDTGAARMSTAGKDQYLALQREDPSVRLDTLAAGQASIKFGNGPDTASIGTVRVDTPIGTIIFHVLETPTPFLLCLADMDRLGVYFDNTKDELVGKNGKLTIPIVRKWGHPWFFLSKTEQQGTFLTETELRRLHRRFGHPATERLYKLLKRAGEEDVDEATLRTIERFCHHCQMHGQAPRRFKFTLKDDHEFNYEILVDVMYLGGKPVLHIVDSSTAFQGARFLPSLSAKDTWEVLRMLWIDAYQGPPDIITHDAGTNFASVEFRNEAKLLGIVCKQIPVEAHWSIGKLERYHAPQRRAFDILYDELAATTSADAILQMAVKAVNDTAGPDGLVPTLLVFGAYPRLTTESPPSPTTTQRGEAIQKAMKALRKANAVRQVNEARSTRNGPSTTDVLALPLQSEVRVWRDKDGWQGPYKIVAVDGHNVTLDMVNGPVVFRSTLLQPYY